MATADGTARDSSNPVLCYHVVDKEKRGGGRLAGRTPRKPRRDGLLAQAMRSDANTEVGPVRLMVSF